MKKKKILTDQSHFTKMSQVQQVDWSVWFFVFLRWDKQPEIDCTDFLVSNPWYIPFQSMRVSFSVLVESELTSLWYIVVITCCLRA